METRMEHGNQQWCATEAAEYPDELRERAVRISRRSVVRLARPTG